MRKYNVEEKALKMTRRKRGLARLCGRSPGSEDRGINKRIAERKKYSFLQSLFYIEYTPRLAD